MADLAVLGLEIRSDDAVRAASDLEKLSTSAKKAEKATEGAGKASEQAAQRMSGSSKAVERLLAAIEKVERAVREQNAMMAKMGASLSNAEAQMLGTTKAAQTVAASVEAAGKAAGAASEQINAVSEAAGSISNAADQAAGGLGRMDRTIQGANDNVELAGHTVNNLRSQILDLGTMIASGSSPFDALKTQAAQIYEALANAEGGATGALKAIWTQVKGFINPTSIVIGLLGAATVAVRYFGDNAERNLQKAEKAAKSYETTVRSLVTAQGDLGSVMGRIFDQEMVGSVAQMQRQLSLLAKEQVEAKKALSENLVKAGVPSALETLNPLGPIKELFRLGTGNTSLGTLGTLGAEFEKGKRSAESLVEELTKLKVSDDLPKDLETIVDKMLEGAQEASKVEARIKAITTAIREQKREIANDNYVKASEAFSGFLPNDLTQRQQIEKAYRERVAAIRDLQDNPRSMEGRLNTAEAERLTALKEIQRQEDVMRDGRALDLAAIGAQTVAERALLAAKRERLALSEPGANKEEIERKAVAAQTQVYAQAEHEAAEALRQSQAARDQADLEGYAAQVAAINAQYARQIELAQGSEAAVRALSEARDLDLKALDISTRKSLFDGQEAELRQLQAEAGLIGQNDDARRKALATLKAEAELRRQGIDLNSAWGASYVQNASHIADMEIAIERQTEAFDAVKDAAEGFFQALASGSGIVDSLLGAFTKLGQAFATKGLNQVLNGVLGSNQSSGGVSNVIQNLSRAGAQTIPVYGANMGVERTFAAPIGAVERKVLPALSSFSTELTAAAKAIRTIESGSSSGNYGAMGPITKTGDRAYGAYQVMGNNIADWSRSAIGREVSKMEFLRSVELQDKIFEHRFGGYMQKYGAEGASRAWFAGEGGMRNYRAQDVVGTSVSGYGSRFGQLYGQHSAESTSVSTRAIEAATAKGTERGYTRAVEGYDSGRFDPGTAAGSAGSSSGLFKLLKSPFGQGTMNALGAFGAGVSGGPISGALTGGLGAIGMGLGPAGIAAGIGAGLLGSVAKNLFNKKEREQAHQQAAADWAAQLPAYDAFKRSLTGKTGTLRDQFGGEWSQFQSFVATGSKAWKRGTGNSTAEFDSTGLLIMNKAIKAMSDFRESFDQLLVDVAKGLGSNSPFTKGTEAVKTMRANYLSALDDVEVAFGKADNGLPLTGELLAWEKQLEDERNKAVAAFKKASVENALGLLDIVEPMSEAAKALDGYRGIAERMTPVLIEMGVAAEEAARAVSERFNGVLAKLRGTFEQGVNDRLLNLQGKGYLSETRDMLKEFAQLQSDAGLLGADQSNFGELLRLQAQKIVDSSELTGDAFAELVRVFPQLSGVVREFSATASQSAKELAQSALDTARSNLDRSYQAETDRLNDLLSARRDEANELESTISKLEDFRDQVREFRDSLKLDDNLSTLNARDRVTEAGRQFQELLAKAKGGDEEARGRLTGAAQEYLNEAKGYYQTSTDYGAIFDEVSKALADTQTTTESALSTAQSQLDALKRQISLDEAQLSIAKAQYDAILGTNEGIKGLQVALAEMAVAIAQARSQGITTPGNTNASQPVSDRSMQYLANNPDVAKAIAAGQTFGALPGSSIEAIIQDHWTRHGQYEVGHGTRVGYSAGGFTGMGGVSDVAGLVHGQEYVMDAASTRAIGVSTLDMMRQTRSLPTIAMPASPRMVSGGNDNRGVEQRLDRLEALMRQQIATTGGGLQRVAEAGEAGARATEQRALAERRSANNKQQAA